MYCKSCQIEFEDVGTGKCTRCGSGNIEDIKESNINKIVEKLNNMSKSEVEDELYRLENKDNINCVVVVDISKDGEVLEYNIEEQNWVEIVEFGIIEDDVRELGEKYYNKKIMIMYYAEPKKDYCYEYGCYEYDTEFNIVDVVVIENDIEDLYNYDDKEGLMKVLD